ncbi:hypothetical protein ACHAWF_009535 [Thalassiosira exigua]
MKIYLHSSSFIIAASTATEAMASDFSFSMPTDLSMMDSGFYGIADKSGKISSSQAQKDICANPLQSVLNTMKCIEDQNSNCAARGYAPTFVKKHNGIMTMDFNGIFTQPYWDGAFFLTNLGLEINYVAEDATAGTHQVNLRYVETIITTDGSNLGLPPTSDYPFNQTFHQHEHALVTVNEDCKMIEWIQYGDNKEQEDVPTAVNAILTFVLPQPGNAILAFLENVKNAILKFLGV